MVHSMSDAGSTSQRSTRSGKSVRASDRVDWVREPIELFVEHPGGSSVRLKGQTHDISRGGMRLSTQTFLHNDTLIRTRLPTINGDRIEVLGKIRWCSYADGVHVSGVMFNEPVRLDLLLPRDQWTEAMLQDDCQEVAGTILHLFASGLDQQLVSIAMRDTNAEVIPCATTGELCDAARKSGPELVVIDLRNEEVDYVKLNAGIAAAGFGGPKVYLTESVEDVIAVECVLGKADAVFEVPVDSGILSNKLSELLQEWQAKLGGEDAMYTTLRSDDSLAGMLDNYLAACRKAAESLSSFQQADDSDGVDRVLRQIAGTAKTFGYAVLAGHTEAALAKLASGASVAAANPEISQVRLLLGSLRTFRPDAAA
jgi:hypothetical protein